MIISDITKIDEFFIKFVDIITSSSLLLETKVDDGVKSNVMIKFGINFCYKKRFNTTFFIDVRCPIREVDSCLFSVRF